jgi:rod shape-determining protein MreC
MQNLLYLLFRYGYILLFIALQIICLNLLIRFNPYQQEIFIKSSNSISGWFYQQQSAISQFFSLTDVARELAAENARLRRAFPHFQGPGSTGDLILKVSTADQQFELIPAKVINNSVIGLDNFFTLQAGTEDGLAKGMGVISDLGVVGIITDVNRQYARGISILNRDCRISAAVKRNHFFGTLYWEGGDPTAAKLGDVPKHAALAVGDTIVTSGYSAIFPEDINLGFIESFSLLDGSNFYDIDVRLSLDLSNIYYVYVIRNLLRSEQLELQTE